MYETYLLEYALKKILKNLKNKTINSMSQATDSNLLFNGRQSTRNQIALMMDYF